jgi:hypothetical protein
MPRGSSRRLVVDASIAYAAGEKPEETSKACREVLQCILSVSHRVVTTPEILREWQEARSLYSRRWLGKMRNLRKIDLLTGTENEELRERIQGTSRDAGVVQAMLKDIHLVEAALATDRIVISLDEKVRRYFAEASSVIDEFKQILWANPVFKRERVVTWLNEGANAEKSRLLGYRNG